ncbi:hypothetical protein GA0070616_2280 [Micromonospora nigra]|uniref:Uncharacterized protein n=1 Tax=Micromonospora nigra TaxID=145857 RepID=A0A1C6RW62_9ACTN|nr:hypothetical protein [Micromonospora nigra]SCL21364.1 hypothetical protein GA0070616_2280 [Micromonospora nigra]
MARRKATSRDLANLVAEWAVTQIHRDDATRQAWRDLPAHVQGEIHGMAADERQRRADGTRITD